MHPHQVLMYFTDEMLAATFDRMNERRRSLPEGDPWRREALGVMLDIAAEQDRRR